MSGDIVMLTESELLVCRNIAVMRHLCNRGGQVHDRQRGTQNKIDIDVDGMVGEYAFAKLLNLFPDFTVSQRSGGADMKTRTGQTVDVKATRRTNGQLLGEVKKKDSYCDVYALMIVDDHSAQFAGWAYGHVLFDDANMVDLGHGPTYALPQSRLSLRINA